MAVTFSVWQGTSAVGVHVAVPASQPQGGDPLVAQYRADKRQLLIASGVALAIMAWLSLALGWLLAGRLLRPLRTITTTTRQISATNLHERLSLPGPDDELKELGDTFDELINRLERSFQFERRFVANASHELRTPLATMRASLDVAMAKPGPVPPQIVTLAERMRHQLDQVDRLLDSFLALAHAQQGPFADESTLSLADIVSAAIERRSDVISLMDLTVGQEVSHDAWVTGSETLLSRMVENVIDNAVTHNQPAGWIRVTTAIEADIVRLIVENGGQILAQTDVQELAQPFRRLGAERTGSDNGTGLGLSIVASIVEIHAGTLELDARSKGGLRVAITLPLAVRSTSGAAT